MGEDFPLLWVSAGAITLFALDWMQRFDPRSLRSQLPPLLLLGGWCLRAQLLELALRWEGVLYNSAPVQFFDHALRLPLS